MKKLLFLLLLCPLITMAGKFSPGTVTMNNGTERTGWINMPETNDNELKFRTEEDGKTERLSIDDVKKFSIQHDDCESTFYALKISNLKTFKKEFHTPGKKSWAMIIAQGNSINIVRLYYYTAAKYRSGNSPIPSSPSEESYIYYFWKPENDYCTYFYNNKTGRIPFGGTTTKQIKYHTEINFGKECPDMIDALKKEDLKEGGLNRLIELYDQNCGSIK